MTDESMGFGLAPDPMLVNTETGKPTYTAQRAKEEKYEAQRENEWTLMDEALTTNNSLVDVATSVAIDLGSSAEEGYDPLQEKGLFDNVPPEFHKRLAKSDSPIEAWAYRAKIDDYLSNNDKLASSGWVGTGAQLAAGLVDADALLVPMSGGTYLGPKVGMTLARAGLKDGRIASTLVGAAQGLEAGAITGVAGATLGTTTDAGDIPTMLLGGMAFGSTIGLATGKGGIKPEYQLEVAMRAHDEYVKAKENDYTNPIMVSGKSVGAARVRFTETPAGLRDSSKPWFDRAADDGNAESARKVIEGREDAETTNIDSWLGRTAQQAQNWVDKSPMKSLYTSVSDMGVIGNKLAYDLLYHPGGLIDGTHPAAGYDALYTQELSVPIQKYHEHAMDFMGRSRDTMGSKVRNAFVRKHDYHEFDKAVKWEMETRYHNNGAGDPNAHRAVKEFADLHDAMTAHAVGIQKGRAGETPVHGSEELEARPGYYSRRWSGDEVKKFDERAVISALTDGYINVLPAGSVIDRALVEKMVKSIVNRSKANAEGIDTNLVGLLRDNGKEFLRDTLKANNISDAEIDSIIGAFVGKAEDRAKPGFLKGRIELDMRTPIPGTNSTLMDLLEPDFYKSMHMYTRKVSGTAALARKGYQLGDKTAIMESIKDEMVQKGLNVSDSRIDDILETTFSYFGAGAVGKGVDPMLMSAMRLTRQSLLGTLGLTQLSELGNMVAMVGVEAAAKAMPAEMRALFSGKKTPLVQELHDAFIFMDKDHILYDDELALDTLGKSSIIQSEFIDGAQKTIGFGDKIAGYTSLFYQSMTFSQRVALSGINHKLYKTLSADALDAGTMRRLLDTGLDETMVQRLQQYIDKGVIKKGDDGELTMGFDKWKNEDLQDYKLAMHQFVSRAVQKNLPGEVPYWATKQFGQFITQLRMFPIQAAQKQFLRNMRHADATAGGAMLWNLGVAGLIYSTSETIKGRGDDLTMEKIAKGAINYAPTTGWMPMVTDPLAEIMGMPELKMNKFGPPGRATDGIIPVPPAIPTLNRMLHIPGAALGSLNGMNRNEASALSSIPIIGNTYGFSAMFNYIKDTGTPDREPRPEAPKAPAKAPAKPKKQAPSQVSVMAPTPETKQATDAIVKE